MCIVIDTCVFAPVFESKCANHSDFKPVLDWIKKGKGKMVYGGKIYKKEIPHSYLKIINELTKTGKAVPLPDEVIDRKTAELKNACNHRDFDDPHIIAMIVISGGRIICSDDSRAFPFFKRKSLYPNKFRIPKIYNGLGSKHILNDRNICKSCRTKNN